MTAPKYLTLRAIPRPSDLDDTYGSRHGPYIDVCYKNRSRHMVYQTETFFPEKRFDEVGYSFEGTYSPDEITNGMLIELAIEFITEREPWGYSDPSDWKIDKGSFDADWVQI